jgi:hypothetical protein
VSVLFAYAISARDEMDRVKARGEQKDCWTLRELAGWRGKKETKETPLMYFFMHPIEEGERALARLFDHLHDTFWIPGTFKTTRRLARFYSFIPSWWMIGMWDVSQTSLTFAQQSPLTVLMTVGVHFNTYELPFINFVSTRFNTRIRNACIRQLCDNESY